MSQMVGSEELKSAGPSRKRTSRGRCPLAPGAQAQASHTPKTPKGRANGSLPVRLLRAYPCCRSVLSVASSKASKRAIS